MRLKKSYKGTEVPSNAKFADTLQCSPLASNLENWVTSAILARSGLDFTPDVFLRVTAHLLQNPNLLAPHLFRADILYDSAGILETPEERERGLVGSSHSGDAEQSNISNVEALPARPYPGLEVNRTVIRRLIPRNQKIDRQLEQTSHFYHGLKRVRPFELYGRDGVQRSDGYLKRNTNLVVYLPHVSSQQDLPWYHPSVRALAYLYEFDFSLGNTAEDQKGTGTLSIHFLPFSSDIPDAISERLQRTLMSLLSTQLRLAYGPPPSCGTISKSFRDNIIPQHIVQNTYVRLKEAHAPGLIHNWVEDTEPSKHVFEDIMIAAFLIELWKLMYGEVPSTSPQTHRKPKENTIPFPGFVDIACGNGVLVYILHAEGYQGWGFDARRRKTWSKFPLSTQDRLKEAICIPKPFAEILEVTRAEILRQDGLQIHSGIFTEGTFIISNHADELTLWTPLLGFLSNPDCPLPFLAIPCCSHALSGAKYRYPAPRTTSTSCAKEAEKPPIRELAHDDKQVNVPNKSPAATLQSRGKSTGELEEVEPEGDQDPTSQPLTGDLKALRLSKLQARLDPTPQTSAYCSLTAKVMNVAEEIGYDVEKTLLRIPSTRNIGIVGGWIKWRSMNLGGGVEVDAGEEVADAINRVRAVIGRETRRDGGLDAAATAWMERAASLRRGQGRGKLKGVRH